MRHDHKPLRADDRDAVNYPLVGIDCGRDCGGNDNTDGHSVHGEIRPEGRETEEIARRRVQRARRLLTHTGRPSFPKILRVEILRPFAGKRRRSQRYVVEIVISTVIYVGGRSRGEDNYNLENKTPLEINNTVTCRHMYNTYIARSLHNVYLRQQLDCFFFFSQLKLKGLSMWPSSAMTIQTPTKT